MKRGLLLVLALMLTGCHAGIVAREGYWVDVRHPAQGARPRVKVIVIHYTAENFSSSLATLTDEEVSAHYLIPRQPPQRAGKDIIWQLVPEQQLAWHAGPSFWRGATRINDTSVGIELVNRGYRQTPAGIEWQPYTAGQIAALETLLRDISRRYGIAPINIVGHSDVAPQRKQDPGPLFPWQQLAEHGLGAWPDAWRVQFWLAGRDPLAAVPVAGLLADLQRLGYAVTPEMNAEAQQRVMAAFQMHFRPADYRGQPDAETAAIAAALLEKYGAAP